MSTVQTSSRVAVSDKKKRVFFALWPSAAQQQCWASLGRDPALPRSRVRPEHIHLTLLFCGAVSARQHACLAQGAGSIRVPRFSLQLDRLGYWRHPQVLWLGCGAEAVPPALMQLVGELRQLARQCGLEPETRAFVPHVTLIRKPGNVPARLPEIKPVEWQPEAFVLVCSELLPQGPDYRVERSWALQPVSGRDLSTNR